MPAISMAGVGVLTDVVQDTCFGYVGGHLPVKRIDPAAVAEERFTFPAQQAPCIHIIHFVMIDMILGL